MSKHKNSVKFILICDQLGHYYCYYIIYDCS